MYAVDSFLFTFYYSFSREMEESLEALVEAEDYDGADEVSTAIDAVQAEVDRVEEVGVGRFVYIMCGCVGRGIVHILCSF